MTLIESIQTCFRKYADFKGRASRSEYWWFTLFVLLVSIASGLLGDAVSGGDAVCGRDLVCEGDAFSGGDAVSGGDAASVLVDLALFLPYLAASARRLHDIGRSGWWQLVGFVPLIGWLVMLYWCVQDSEGPNTYG